MITAPFFQHVLVAVEPEDDCASIDAAHRLALAFGAALSVVQVVPSAPWPDNDTKSVQAEDVAALQALDALVAKRTTREAGSFQSAVVHGEPAEAIIGYAQRQQASLVVVGTHGRRGLERLVLGSVAASVIRTAPCSVLVARASAPEQGPIVTACDLAVRMDPVIAAAGAVAKQLGERMMVLHAVEPNMSDAAIVATTIFSGVVPQQPDKPTVDAIKEAATGALRAELASAAVDASTEIAAGPAGPLALARAQEQNASLIVVGSHNRGRVARLLLGSVAEEVVRGASCNVLVVR